MSHSQTVSAGEDMAMEQKGSHKERGKVEEIDEVETQNQRQTDGTQNSNSDETKRLAFSRMDERIGRMKQVAENGNIDGFYNLIQEDVKYLEYIDEFPFVDTPLHIAASAGNIPVAMEMMRLKPSFARKPNRDGFSPIDLALLNGHTKMVHQLLHVDQDLVRVRGRENMTPLHHVAKGNHKLDCEEKRNDKLDLLIEFLSICPDSITDVTTQNETALHIALQNDQIESFKALVGWLASCWSQNASDYERKILNWKDDKGNTVFHIAASKYQTEAVRHLFAWSNEVDIKIKNEKCETALGILKTQTGNSEMRRMPIRVGAPKGSSITTDSSYAHYLRPPKCRPLEKIRTKYARQMATISDDKRNALLVVATLLLSVTYQAALNPPGGLHEAISKPGANSSRISTSQAYVPCPANATYHRTCGKKNLFKGTTEGQGTANLVNTIPFSMFLVSNSVTFLISNSVTILLTPDGYIGWMLSGTQAFLWACYIVSFAAITGYKWYWITPISIGTALYLILLQVFSAWTRIRSRRHGLGQCGLLIRFQENIILEEKKRPSLEAGVV